MKFRIRYFLPLIGLCLIPPAARADSGSVRCGANQDRVWVYESLNSFDVEVKLRCGDTVEIVTRVKGYVKIRTASGVEGYVTESTFPDLPPLPDDSDKPASVAAAAARTASRPVATVAVAAVPPSAPAAPPPAAAVSTTPVAPVSVAPTIASQPSVDKPAAAAVAAAPVTPIATHAPAPAPAPTPKPAPAVVAVAKPAPAPIAPPAPPPMIASVSAKPVPPAPAANIAPTAKVSTPAPVAKSIPVVTASVQPPPSSTKVAKGPVSPPAAQPTLSVARDASSEKAPAAPASVLVADRNNNVASSRDLAAMKSPAAAPEPESEDYPDARPENESADPACQVFFSAYGLAPAQYKWLVENRRKEHASICPSPDLSRVDFVILFAHDSDTYASAMPTPVHTDRNGFSDFSPMTTVDTALISESDIEKARYEFVWVFRMKRGTFNPSAFSAKRRPQFTTGEKGSRASSRAIDEAFHFMEGQQTANP